MNELDTLPRGYLESSITSRYEVDDNGCWVWQLSLNRQGYGQLYLKGVKKRNWRPHRVSYYLYVGELIDGLCLDHLCRNRACINPEHLEQVTIKENNLRGEGIPAINARKTRCLRGHELSGDNLYIHRGGRYCRECKNIILAATLRYNQKLNANYTEKCQNPFCKNTTNKWNYKFKYCSPECKSFIFNKRRRYENVSDVLKRITPIKDLLMEGMEGNLEK